MSCQSTKTLPAAPGHFCSVLVFKEVNISFFFCILPIVLDTSNLSVATRRHLAVAAFNEPVMHPPTVRIGVGNFEEKTIYRQQQCGMKAGAVMVRNGPPRQIRHTGKNSHALPTTDGVRTNNRVAMTAGTNDPEPEAIGTAFLMHARDHRPGTTAYQGPYNGISI